MPPATSTKAAELKDDAWDLTSSEMDSESSYEGVFAGSHEDSSAIVVTKMPGGKIEMAEDSDEPILPVRHSSAGINDSDDVLKDSSHEYGAGRPHCSCNPPPVWRAESYIPLEVPEASMPTLTNKIHDIWSYAAHKNWVFGSQVRHGENWRIYEFLMPAMQLASLWLTRPEYQAFWTTIQSSPCKLNEERNNWSLEGTKARTLPSAKVQKDLEKQLLEIGKKLTFCFTPLGHTNGRWASRKAISQCNSDSWRGNSLKSGYVTILDMEFAAPLGQSAPSSYPKWIDERIPAKLGFLFLFAVQLSGQLAEVLWLDRRHKEGGEEDGIAEDQSVTIDGVRYDCMSDAFEGVFFGGRVEEVEKWPGYFRYRLAVHFFDKGASSLGPDTLRLTTHEINQRFSSAWWALMDGKR
ncbi:MAG: hypothetical protein Q9173_006925 [Seirophora scorigena]